MRESISRLLNFVIRCKRWLLGITIALALYALAGFFLAPWLVKKNAVESVRVTYDADLRIEKLVINPFVLSLRIDGLEFDDPGGDPFARVEQIFVNFQLSSLFRWAWTFREFRVDTPELFIARNGNGDLNLAFLLNVTEPAAEATAGAEGSDDPLRLLIHEFAINEAVAHWDDDVPVEAVDTTFGPVNILVSDLSTLPQREGQQDVVITTETTGTLAWSGSLQLNPLRSSGHASVKGSHFPLLSAYVRHELAFDIFRGDADVELDYAVDTLDDGSLAANVENFELMFSDLAVRTFSGNAGDAADADRDILEVPALRLAGGALRWPERRVSLASITVDDAVVSAYRNATGAVNLLPAGGDAPAEEQPTAAAPKGRPWDVELGRFEVNSMSIGVIDDSVEPHADIGVEGLNLVVSGISNAAGTSFPTTLSTRTRSGGYIGADGAITVLPDPIADFDLEFEGLSLALLHPYIKPLADVNLDSGALNLAGHVFSGPDEPLLLTGDLSVVDFLITETDEGSRLGSWKSFAANDLTLDLGDGSLEISEVRLDQAYADIFVAENGTANLGRVGKGVQDTANEEVEDGSSADEAEAGAAEGGGLMDVTVGRIIIADAAADFADFSLPLPFDAKIADLNGDLSTIATTSVEPSAVSLEGKVDDYGLVNVSGAVTPLEPALNTDIKLSFRNVSIPKFSAYTVAFAGREIASGKLDLDLGYAVNDGDLAGENRIVLREFELGEKVEHPGAMSLPLGLAVALLKDPSGKIDIDLPVRGNVNDPEFRYGRVVLSALGNLIVKIVASPFALLGKLVGVEASELEQVNFVVGRADLTPPEMERVAKLAEALTLRPQLLLEIAGVFDRDSDALALKKAQLDAMLEERIEASDGEDQTYMEQRRIVLEQLFREHIGVEDRDAALTVLQTEHTSLTTDEVSGKTTEQFDELAYVAGVAQYLIEALAIPQEELLGLANSRADNTRAAIVTIDASLDSRIRVSETHLEASAADDSVPMKVKLTTGEPDT